MREFYYYGRDIQYRSVVYLMMMELLGVLRRQINDKPNKTEQKILLSSREVEDGVAQEASERQ